VEYCTCRKKDGCNTATGMGSSWMVIVVGVLASLGLGKAR